MKIEKNKFEIEFAVWLAVNKIIFICCNKLWKELIIIHFFIILNIILKNWKFSMKNGLSESKFLKIEVKKNWNEIFDTVSEMEW